MRDSRNQLKNGQKIQKPSSHKSKQEFVMVAPFMMLMRIDESVRRFLFANIHQAKPIYYCLRTLSLWLSCTAAGDRDRHDIRRSIDVSECVKWPCKFQALSQSINCLALTFTAMDYQRDLVVNCLLEAARYLPAVGFARPIDWLVRVRRLRRIPQGTLRRRVVIQKPWRGQGLRRGRAPPQAVGMVCRSSDWQ